MVRAAWLREALFPAETDATLEALNSGAEFLAERGFEATAVRLWRLHDALAAVRTVCGEDGL